MLCGAIGVLITGQITPYEAAKAINMDVMLFLLGVFIIGGTLEESGYIMQISNIIPRKVKSMNQLIIALIFVIGFTSAFLMNDTMAIIGVPSSYIFQKIIEYLPNCLYSLLHSLLQQVAL